jgi:hypothetical protein
MHLCRIDFATADDATVWSVEHQSTVDGVKFAERKELQVGLAHGSSIAAQPGMLPVRIQHSERTFIAKELLERWSLVMKLFARCCR